MSPAETLERQRRAPSPAERAYRNPGNWRNPVPCHILGNCFIRVGSNFHEILQPEMKTAMIHGIKMKGLRAVTTLILSFPLVCTCAYGQSKAESEERIVQESHIRESVIRFQMEEWSRNMDNYEARAKEPWEKETARGLNYKVYFVRINGKDPSDKFVKRLSNIPRVVKKASAAQMRTSGSEGVVDRQTHETGIIFSADAVRWIGSDSVEADGGYYCGLRCASARTFAVHLEAGKWTAKLLRVNSLS